MTLGTSTASGTHLEDETVRFYRECVEAYLGGAPFGIRPYIEEAMAALLQQAGHDPLLLDIGCGSGRLVQYVLDLGVNRYIGIDASEPLLELARQEYETPGIEFRNENILSLSRAMPERVDVCVSCYALSHISRANFDTALREIRAVMKDGGTGLLEFILGDEEVVATKEEIPDIPDGYKLNLTYWTLETIGPYFARNGFEILDEPNAEEYLLTLKVRAI